MSRASANQVEYLINEPDQLAPVMGEAFQMAGRGLRGGPVRLILTRTEEKRSDSQNRLLWAILRDVSEQVVWYGKKLSSDDWKQVFTAGLKRQTAVPGIDGGFVMLGSSTSRMNKREFSDLVELIYAFGSDQQVAWSDPALRAYEQIKEVA